MQVSPARYRQIAYAALAVCTLIVFTGAAVRLTGSGLGCPDWPRCDGSSLTPELHTHGLIEFGNRVMTSVVAIPCLAAACLAWRRRPFRRDLLLIALLLPLGVAAQAVWGGFTVIYDLAPGLGDHALPALDAAAGRVRRARVAGDVRAAASGRAAPTALSTWAVRAAAACPGAATLAGGTIATAAGPARGRRGHRRRRRADHLARRGDAGLGDPAARRRMATFLGLAAVGVWFLAARAARRTRRRRTR